MIKYIYVCLVSVFLKIDSLCFRINFYREIKSFKKYNTAIAVIYSL